jgi:hypothetical protein
MAACSPDVLASSAATEHADIPATLWFQRPEELADSLAAAELAVDEVRDAPDRPDRESVTPEPMRSDWLGALAMARSVLPQPAHAHDR